MISHRARRAFDEMLSTSLRGTFAGAATGFAPVPGLEQVGERQAVMLSVAACRFRLMLFLHFDADAATRALLARLKGLAEPAPSDQWFLDALSEYGNLSCGALNRELGRAHACLGMSTPHVVERDSLLHLGLLRPGYLRHYRLELAGGHRFHVTLCVCEQGVLDFEPPPPQEAPAQAAGELELF
jgi:hypothetical protein